MRGLTRRPPERNLLPLGEAQAAPLQATKAPRPDRANVYQNTAAGAPTGVAKSNRVGDKANVLHALPKLLQQIRTKIDRTAATATPNQ